MTNVSLIKVECIAECSPWSILQYFWPALSDNEFWKTSFDLSESGRFTQVLLYVDGIMNTWSYGVLISDMLKVSFSDILESMD